MYVGARCVDYFRPVHILDRLGPIGAGLVGGFVSVLASPLALGYDSSHTEQTDEGFRHFVTPQWAGFILVRIRPPDTTVRPGARGE